MTSLITMYDDISVSTLPAGATAYAGYVDGKWANYPAIKAKYPAAHVLSIAVFATDDAECLDVEPGDATRADIYAWFKRQQARGVYRPVVYSSVVNMDDIVATMGANGFARDSYRLWAAHYQAGAHICGPSTCKLTHAQCDGTQWTNSALSRSLDESELLPGFFDTAPPPAKRTWHEWDTAGDSSLAALAAKLDVGPATLLSETAKHYGYFNGPLGNYLKGLAEGTVKPTDPMPKGCRLWVYA